MNYYKSNQNFERKRNQDLKIPTSREEFENMSYLDRVQLKEEHPKVYEMFVRKDSGFFTVSD